VRRFVQARRGSKTQPFQKIRTCKYVRVPGWTPAARGSAKQSENMKHFNWGHMAWYLQTMKELVKNGTSYEALSDSICHHDNATAAS